MKSLRIVALLFVGLIVSGFGSCQGPALTFTVGESLRDSITVINSVRAEVEVTVQAGQSYPIVKRLSPYERHTFLVGSLFSRWDDQIILVATYLDNSGRPTGCFATREYRPYYNGRIKEVWSIGRDVYRDDRGNACR